VLRSRFFPLTDSPTDRLTDVRRIITNADDFGLTEGVNRAVAELHAQGLLSSATLMARAAATDKAVERARATPTLGVGCHVVLVDGAPVLPVSQLRTLVDPATGRFQPTLGRFLSRLLSGCILATEIEAEAAAQIAWLQNRGLELTHIDTHKHAHMFPGVLVPLLRAAVSRGVSSIRNPFEPAWSLRSTPAAPLLRRTQVALLRLLEPGFRRRVHAAGLRTTAGSIGILATGTLDVKTVSALLNALPSDEPDAIWELVTHPGYNDAALAQSQTRLLASRDVERVALSALRQFPAIRTVRFDALELNALEADGQTPGGRTPGAGH